MDENRKNNFIMRIKDIAQTTNITSDRRYNDTNVPINEINSILNNADLWLHPSIVDNYCQDDWPESPGLDSLVDEYLIYAKRKEANDLQIEGRNRAFQIFEQIYDIIYNLK